MVAYLVKKLLRPSERERFLPGREKLFRCCDNLKMSLGRIQTEQGERHPRRVNGGMDLVEAYKWEL